MVGFGTDCRKEPPPASYSPPFVQVSLLVGKNKVVVVFVFFCQGHLELFFLDDRCRDTGIRSQGEVQKSSALLDHLNYSMLKGYY